MTSKNHLLTLPLGFCLVCSDLKSSNILLTREGVAKIADVGKNPNLNPNLNPYQTLAENESVAKIADVSKNPNPELYMLVKALTLKLWCW